MSTDHHFTIGKQLAQMLGSLWAQTKVGLEVGLDADDRCQIQQQGGLAASTLANEHELCEWQGHLTANGLGSLDVGGAPTWLDD